ncbi:uncharacterized protein LAESUDRAFT_56856 [Laetiporus sulphureus 93-53]|uniref:Uncharacterized protein n=1 Tax=Laetiporus sulphureus 93-53 TaxID=1314785 RepID=A0A165FDU3_9APHY|nr:uncharacterized protein LAESUDRAFT_56856 [Laetiporus sulphureus 93-53]KZT08819.1 hypothetical protein LAESUDRAFT_56856 [Laetiporus sulphureus 93-53]
MHIVLDHMRWSLDASHKLPLDISDIQNVEGGADALHRQVNPPKSNSSLEGSVICTISRTMLPSKSTSFTDQRAEHHAKSSFCSAIPRHRNDSGLFAMNDSTIKSLHQPSPWLNFLQHAIAYHFCCANSVSRESTCTSGVYSEAVFDGWHET